MRGLCGTAMATARPRLSVWCARGICRLERCPLPLEPCGRMFSRISQLGKNITEEFEQAVSGGRNPQSGSRDSKGQRQTVSPAVIVERNAHLMKSNTPDPATMEMPESDTKAPSGTESPAAASRASEDAKEERSADTERDGTREGTPAQATESGRASGEKGADDNSGNAELPKEIQAKLRKFAKYEDKYPRM